MASGRIDAPPHLAVFHFHPVVHRGSTGFSTDGTFHYMLEVLIPSFPRITVYAQTVDSSEVKRETIGPPLAIQPIPGARNGWEFYISRLPHMCWHILWLFLRHRREWDLVWILDGDVHSQYVYLLCKLFRCPAVLYLRAREDLGVKWPHRSKVRSALAWLAVGWLRHTIPVMVRRMPAVLTGAELYTLYPGPHTHQFVSSLVRRSDIRPREVRERDVPCLLVVGRVAPLKGLDTLIRALPLLPYHVRLRIIGPSFAPYERRLKELAAELGVEGQVEFAGPLPFGDDLWRAYDEADLYVHPSLAEGTPKSLVEAMARGLPVVASAVGGIPGMLRDGEAGVLVPPGEVRTMAAALTRLLADRALRERLAARSVERARELTVDTQMAQVMAFLRKTYPGIATRSA